MGSHKFYSIWLAIIIIFIFILQSIIPDFTQALVLNQSSYSQIYRFISAIFLHGSLQHLVFNLFALIFFGLILEKFIGSNKFLLVFFISGILANIIGVNFYNSSLGASGAIFGIIGTLTIKKPLITVWAFSLPMPMFLASILWVIGDIIGIFNPTGTGNIAHLSGLFFGLIFGLIFKTKHQKNQSKKPNYKINISEQDIRFWEDNFLKN